MKGAKPRATASNAARARGEVLADRREELIAEARRIIQTADPDVVEERKWKKPSRPEGVPVWSHDGILCVADSLKGRVRLSFPKGASIPDPQGLFNTRLDSRTVRAIDVPEGETINEDALKGLIRAALALNLARSRTKR